ncbi:MAG: SCP2 domain-containing protein [Burkholderiales bacterium]
MNPYAFPEPLRVLLTRLPHYPASAAFAALLTLWLGEQFGTTALPELSGRRIRLRISDMGITLIFRAAPGGFVPCRGDAADLTLAARAEDFLSLALRREDPDTLFFSRRLVMEGDTELGLLVKNTLDALDPAQLRIRPPAPATALRLLGLTLREQWHDTTGRPPTT